MRSVFDPGIGTHGFLLGAALAALIGTGLIPLVANKVHHRPVLLDGTAMSIKPETISLTPAASIPDSAKPAPSALPKAYPGVIPLNPSGVPGVRPEFCQGGLHGVSPFAARRSSASVSDALAMTVVVAMLCKANAAAPDQAQTAR